MGCHLDALKYTEMHHFLPLSEYEIVLLEVLPKQLHRRLAMLHNNLPVLIVLGRLEQVPPPSALLEYLEQELRIVSATHEPPIMRKELPFEIELDGVALVQSVEKLAQHLLLRMAYEGLRSQVSIFGDIYLELLGQ